MCLGAHAQLAGDDPERLVKTNFEQPRPHLGHDSSCRGAGTKRHRLTSGIARPVTLLKADTCRLRASLCACSHRAEAPRSWLPGRGRHVSWRGCPMPFLAGQCRIRSMMSRARLINTPTTGTYGVQTRRRRFAGSSLPRLRGWCTIGTPSFHSQCSDEAGGSVCLHRAAFVLTATTCNEKPRDTIRRFLASMLTAP